MSKQITLQVIAGERAIEEIRTVTGVPGDGGVNDLISVRLALELGCRIKPSKCEQYSLGSDGTSLEVVGISRLKLRRLGHFGREPHWTDVSVLVIHNLHSVYGRDMLLS